MGEAEEALIAGQNATDRLSPAEAHRILRQRLTTLVVRWDLLSTDAYRLSRHTHIHTYIPGEVILPRGAHGDCLGLIVRGHVALQAGPRQAPRTEVVLLPGSTFGEAMLSDGRPSGTTLQALSPCEIWFVHRADLQSLHRARREARWAKTLKTTTRGIAWMIALCLILALALSLPVARRAAALAPMSLGQWCLEQGHPRCAEQAWTVAANFSPDDANPWLGLGALYFEQGDIGRAEGTFQVARSLASNLPEVHNNLGLIYARQGDHARAVAAFARALALDPGMAAVEHNLGVSLQASGDHAGAVRHFRSALALGEPQAGTWVNLAIAYYETGQPDEALDAAQQALALDPDLAAAHTVRGAVALQRDRPEAALPDLYRAIALDAEGPEAHFYLGLAFKSLNRGQEAILAFERALAGADDEATRVRIRRYLNELYEVEREGRVP